MAALLEKINLEFAELTQSATDCVVRVLSHRKGAAAGTIIRNDGILVTNAHVIGSGDVKVAFSDGIEWLAEVIAMDRDRDLAVLSIQANALPTLPHGDSKKIRAGEWVIAFGNPWGVFGAATAGVVIGHGKQLPERPDFGDEWIAINLHYRPGHSGGPLVDTRGSLIGINTIMTGPDVGLAIPIHEVDNFLERHDIKLSSNQL